MVKVVAKSFVKSDNIEAAAPLFKEMLSATRQEDGCIEYRLFFDPGEPGNYTFIEEWASREALDKHIASEHFKRILPMINDLCSKPGDILILDEFV